MTKGPTNSEDKRHTYDALFSYKKFVLIGRALHS